MPGTDIFDGDSERRGRAQMIEKTGQLGEAGSRGEDLHSDLGVRGGCGRPKGAINIALTTNRKLAV